MWIILLDHSGSMGEPFRGSNTFKGRSVDSLGGTKLEEARCALYERVHGLAPSEKVVVIAFTSKASVVFDGLASQTDELRSALDSLEATNGTSIAAAFDEAVAFLKPMGRTDSRVLLVSDCKSELAPAVVSADRLIQIVHVIDVLLIDPDPETEEAARAMIRLGEVQAIVSSEDLRTAVTDGDKASEQVAMAMARVIEDAKGTAKRALERRARYEGEPIGSEVGFSAGYAPRLSPEHTAPLFVLIHPAHLKNEVGEVIAHLLSGQTSDPRIAADCHLRLPKGAEIRIEPVVSGVRINPARIEVIWQDRIEDFKFTMSADPDSLGTYALGSVNVWYGPAQISCLPISIEISDSEPTSLSTIEVSDVFRAIFPSYSRADKSVVDRARGYYEALGIAVLQDTEALRSGAGVNWERALDGLILKADAFQLYWSHSAAKSEQVEREWRFAFLQNSLKGDRWIRPLRWMDDIPDLPHEIEHLQMGWLPGFDKTERSITPAAESIRCTVTPLVDCPPEQRRIVERECREAIHYVETITGLRCYPPPVLLVDEFVFQKELHSSLAIDKNIIVRFAAAEDILKALSLDIHTGFGRGQLYGKQSPKIDLNLSLSDKPRHQALGLAEWVFASVADTVLGISGFVQPRKYGMPSGSPEEIASRALPPSARLAEAVSGIKDNSRSSEVTFRRDRSQLSNTAIEWLRQTSSKVKIRVQEDEVKIKMDEETLIAVLKQALSPAVTKMIDNVNPFNIKMPEGETPEFAIFAWLAPKYFKNYVNRTDCAALVESIIRPNWRVKLDSFADANGLGGIGPIEILGHLIQSLQRAFDEVEVVYGSGSDFIPGYKIAPQTLAILGATDVRPKLQGSEPRMHIEGTIPALKRLYTLASEVFLETLRTIQGKIERHAPRTIVEAHTYGVFIPAGREPDRQLAAWAAKNNIAEALTFPGSDRVLLCIEAIRRCTQGIDDESARRIVRQSVLVHEFFHAAISSAVGPDEARQSAQRQARRIEEALAVWLEFDAARDCVTMRDMISEYASSGVYPEWPYAGLSSVELKFKTGGRDAIQSLINELIDDPKTLQSAFDGFVAKNRGVI